MVSVVPGDSVKPTAKSDKAAVVDGTCLWENPVYETVKFNQDSKSGKVHERIYYFIVGTVMKSYTKTNFYAYVSCQVVLIINPLCCIVGDI